MKFIAKPVQIEEKINEWKALGCGYIKFDSIDTFSGYKVHALIFTNNPNENSKPAIYFSQPHAHEPATTAGMVDVIEQLATGRDLMGNKTRLDAEEILSELTVIFCPAGNPYGLDRAPVLYWDGTWCSNDKFWTIMFGEDPENPGKMWNRQGQWDIREVKAPNPIGIVYEPVDQYTYVEPNRSQLSSYFKMFHRLNAEYGIKYWAELHQTEFVDSEYNNMVIMPSSNYTPENMNAVNRQWADAVTEAWKNIGFNPCEPVGFCYDGQQAEYFRQNYSEINKKIYKLTSEVKNNGKDFTPEMQLQANVTAIISSIDWALSRKNDKL